MAKADNTDLRLGLCGWNGSQPSYFENFDSIEIQSTFYDPPSLQVARRWRSAAPADFHFCIKAWQRITHRATSPTYRRLLSPLPAEDREAVGSFQETEQVWQAWLRTVDVARTVDARVILFQCPKPFLPKGIVQDLCAEHDLLHCVDPFEMKSVHGDIRYWRLHGRGSYSYRYTDADLAALKRRLIKRPQPGYVMFNNFSSRADALRFRRLAA
jgi:uncharacterized protein YecE (DUF72 family)